MRGRRQSLQVTTFPFLAVLLCAMGSLILLLLVIDRRAKAVARAKAMHVVARLTADDAEAFARRRAEIELRRHVLTEELNEQARELVGQIDAVRAQGDSTADAIQFADNQRAKVEKQIETLADQLAQRQSALKARETELRANSARTGESHRELAAMTEELVKLERALTDIKAARSREPQTYSLVPYRGKRGDNRKPVYVECDAGGLILHPDRQAVDVSNLRADVENRIAKQRTALTPSAADEKPYLLFLVRPAGIANYYRAMSALEGMKVDFGYEFVETEWVFDFAESEQWPAQPWMTGEPPRVVKTEQRSERGAPPAITTEIIAPGPEAFPSDGSAGQGNRWTPRGDAANLARPCSGASTNEAAFGPQVGFPSPRRDSSTGPISTAPPGARVGAAVSGDRGSVTTERAAKPIERLDGPELLPSQHGSANSATPAHGRNTRPPTQAVSSIPSSGATTSTATPGPSTPTGSVTHTNGNSAGARIVVAETPSSSSGQAVRTLPSRDWFITVECTPEGVIISPGAILIALESFTGRQAENLLRQSVERMIARRHSMARAGEAPDRAVIHFRVRPEGLRSYYLAYPVLEPLRVPMTRENLRPESERVQPAGVP